MSKCTRIAFTGDIGFDKFMEGKWEDDALIDTSVLEFVNGADHAVINVEGPIVDQEANSATTGAAQLVHSINPAAVKVLKNIGADVWNLCNNHICDAGEDGIASTLKFAADSKVQTIGAGMNIDEASKPLIIDEAGGIGIFAVGYSRACRIADESKAGCLNWTRMDIVEKNIKSIKEKCRWCIVVAHDGEEFTALPNPYTRNRFLKYLEMGADIVVAHHPHVPMNYELVGDKAIFYSLGNFIFDTPYQRSQFNTDKGIVLRLTFDENNYSFEAKGIEIDRENERVKEAQLPDIFENVPEEEYKLLIPLAAKVFIENTKRQQIYMKPEIYTDATEEIWQENFLNPMRGGRVEGEVLDLYEILPIAQKESEKAWEKSRLEKVKAFMLEELPR